MHELLVYFLLQLLLLFLHHILLFFFAWPASSAGGGGLSECADEPARVCNILSPQSHPITIIVISSSVIFYTKRGDCKNVLVMKTSRVAAVISPPRRHKLARLKLLAKLSPHQSGVILFACAQGRDNEIPRHRTNGSAASCFLFNLHVTPRRRPARPRHITIRASRATLSSQRPPRPS